MWSASAKNCIWCPPAWIVYGDHCYYLLTVPGNFTTAQATCQNLNSTMIFVNNAVDFYNAQFLYLRTYWPYWVSNLF